jgi:hypothetical protein
MKTLLDRLFSGASWAFHIGLLLIVASQSAALAEEKVYYFVDENGVTHLSNTPSDPRYKPLGPVQRKQAPATSLRTDPLPAEEPVVPEIPLPTPGLDEQSPERAIPEPPVVPQPVPDRER